MEPEVSSGGEGLLFEPMPMQAPAAPHIDMTTGEQPSVDVTTGGTPTQRMSQLDMGPPPAPLEYDPSGVGYMATGASYLTAAQEVPFAPVYPGYPPASQVSAQRVNTQGLKPPKWNEDKQALAKWLQEIIMYFRTTTAPRQQWGWIALHTLEEAVKHSLLAQLGHIWGVALDAEILSHPDFQLSWE